MDFWFLLVFILAVPLATSRTEAQSTTTTSSASITTDKTTNTVFPIPSTTTAIVDSATVPFATSSPPIATTDASFTVPTDQTNAAGETTTTYHQETATTTSSDLTSTFSHTLSYPTTATTLTTSDFLNATTTTTTTSAYPFSQTPEDRTTMVPEDTTHIPRSTTVTTVQESTTLVMEGTPVITTPEGTTLITVPGSTAITTVQESTTLVMEGTPVITTPEGTTLITVPGGTAITNVQESTALTTTLETITLTPGSSTVTTVPEGTTLTPGSSTTAFPQGTTQMSEETTLTTEGTRTTASTATTIHPATTSIGATTTTTIHPTTTSIGATTTTTIHPATTSTGATNTTTIHPATTSTGATTTTTHPTTTITTTTTTIPPTTTPLVCENGGISLNGVCICPDDWTGKTCSVGNFCEAEKVGIFHFPRTPIGWFAYSEEKCPKGTSGAGKPEASTRCSMKNGTQSFDRPQVFRCDQTLSDIKQNLTSPADLEMLASSTQILTSNTEELTAENVTTAAQIANTLLLSPNATESVRVAAVATVSQLLNASTPDDSQENNATLSLTVTLDQLSMNLSQSLNTSQSQVVQPNLVVQSAQIPAADTQGVQFTSLSGTSGSFVADRIQLNTNVSTVVVENGFVADALIYVRFPPEALSGRQKPSNVSVGFVLYQNDRFFRSRRYRRGRATIRVLSASLRGQERSVVPQHVEMLFRPTMLNGTSLYDFACVFWNYSLQDWSTDGCSKTNASDGVLRCFCNHTTNFAVLWSFKENYEYAEALDVISIVGLSFSILGLVVTLIHHIKVNFQKKSRGAQNNQDSKIALLCIYLSLLAFIITFLSGVGNSSRQNDAEVEVNSQTNVIPGSDEHVDPDQGSCSAVAALLQFFLLATFMWNSVYGTQLVLLVRTLRRSLPPQWTKLSLTVGWGVPVVVTAITLGATYRVDNPLGYRQEEFCWLAALDKAKRFDFGKPMFWGFLLPVGLILIYNIVLLVLASLITCRTDPNLKSNNRRSLSKKFLISFSLSVLLGLSWTLGYLVLVTTAHTHLVFSIVFCLCTTTQGFQIFILFTARTQTFRAAVLRSAQYASSVSIQLNYTKYSLWKNLWKTTNSESYRDLRHKDGSTTETL